MTIQQKYNALNRFVRKIICLTLMMTHHRKFVLMDIGLKHVTNASKQENEHQRVAGYYVVTARL